VQVDVRAGHGLREDRFVIPVEGVRIDGLKELNRALKKYSVDAQKELVAELKNSPATQKILRDAKQGIQSSIGKGPNGLSRSTGRAVGSLRVTSNMNGVFIIGGKARVPYYGWLDFGGVLKPSGGRKNTQRQHVFIKKGRGIYPAIDHNRAGLRNTAEEAMGRAKQKAGL
jgi:hypothetical protein